MNMPKTKQRNAYPGDQAVIFTAPATDASGKQWPRGTELVPLSGGFDNAAGCKYQQFTNGARFLAR